MAERKALVLANGDLGDAVLLQTRLRPIHFDIVIAADGGARHAAALGLTLDRIVGDFDSLPPGRDDVARRATVHRQSPIAKDETDLELALLEALQAGATQAVVLAAAGGRLDMTLANVGLLAHPALQGLAIELWIGAETVYLLLPPGREIRGDIGDRVSLIPLGGEAVGITTHGLAFPLMGETLAIGPARGVSNRVAQVAPRVDFTSGALLVFHQPRGDPPATQGRRAIDRQEDFDAL